MNNLNNIGASLANQYKAALFIDNSQHHVDDMLQVCNRGMSIIKVDEMDPPPMIEYTNPIMVHYHARIGNDNTYVKMITRISTGYYFDPTSGIQMKHIPEIEKWINDTASMTPRAVIFDWDRTISVMEGVYTSPNGLQFFKDNVIPKKFDMRDIPIIHVEDVLLYLCGGSERLNMLRIILSELVKLGIDVIFLTNNGTCKNDNLYGFNELVSGLMPPGMPYKIICSRDPPFVGHKGKALRDVIPDKSSLMCLDMSTRGGQRKTRRKSKRKGKSRSASRKAYK